ncbi:MAG TPA: hypothetical protein VE971_02110 [Candidatus Eisenbacteria bacterium]|nr:hypothetical protein [Candidatus Eisenbacteria bacterium]
MRQTDLPKRSLNEEKGIAFPTTQKRPYHRYHPRPSYRHNSGDRGHSGYGGNRNTRSYRGQLGYNHKYHRDNGRGTFYHP